MLNAAYVAKLVTVVVCVEGERSCELSANVTDGVAAVIINVIRLFSVFCSTVLAKRAVQAAGFTARMRLVRNDLAAAGVHLAVRISVRNVWHIGVFLGCVIA